ncbi:hypothetical protein [Aquifex sp.]
MIPQGINLLYLPPFSIIGRFFATAVLFGLLEGLFLLYQAISGSFYLFPTVHLFTLGFMTLTMIGALFQMLPVVAGAVIEDPLEKAFVVHLTLSTGAFLLPLGAALGSFPLTLLSLLFLLSGVFYIVPIMLKKLFTVKELRDAPRGFRYSLLSFGIAVILGALLVLSLLGLVSTDYSYLLDLHLSFMLFGWTATLVASVSFQVIEMFFVTPPYPKVLTRNLARTTFLLLLLKFLLPKVVIIDTLISLLFVIYAGITIDRLRKRRRKLPDPLIYLWYVGMIFLILSAMFYPLRHGYFYLFILSFGLFVLSVIMSMMYRIIPFLVWMHLMNKGVTNAPTMHQIIEPDNIWTNFYVHLSAIISLVLLLSGEELIPSLFFFVNFLLLAVNIYRGIGTYIKFSS